METKNNTIKESKGMHITRKLTITKEMYRYNKKKNVEALFSLLKETARYGGRREHIITTARLIRILENAIDKIIPEDYPYYTDESSSYILLPDELYASLDSDFGECSIPIKLGAYDTTKRIQDLPFYVTHGLDALSCRYNRLHYYVFIGKIPVCYKWVRELVDAHLKGKRCLELGAFNGVLTKALQDCGVSCIATDDYEDFLEETMFYRGNFEKEFGTFEERAFTNVDVMSPIDAINTYGRDVDVVITPWFDEESGLNEKIFRQLREVNPACKMVYIGSGDTGFFAGEFFDVIGDRLHKFECSYVPWDVDDDGIYIMDRVKC